MPRFTQFRTLTSRFRLHAIHRAAELRTIGQCSLCRRLRPRAAPGRKPYCIVRRGRPRWLASFFGRSDRYRRGTVWLDSQRRSYRSWRCRVCAEAAGRSGRRLSGLPGTETLSAQFFSSYANGGNPYGNLALWAGGVLYGTYGGVHSLTVAVGCTATGRRDRGEF
jgi:hypothetical protein